MEVSFVSHFAKTESLGEKEQTHVYSCVKGKTNLMPLILLFIQYSFVTQHVSAVNTTIFRSLRLTGCYYMGGIWFGVCWRSVSVWLWRCGVFMQSEALRNLKC